MRTNKLYKSFAFILVGYILVYVALLFINLHIIPLAWIDEIMGIDPALNFVQGKGFCTSIWSHPGTENKFIAYLPLQGILHILSLYVLPFDIYWMRFPWAIYLITGAFLMYKSLRIKGINLIITLAIVILFLNEKSLFETTRGVRIEPFIFLLLALNYYARNIKWLHIQVICASLLLITHPNTWPISFVLFLSACSDSNIKQQGISRFITPNKLWAYPVFIILSYLIFIEFDFQLFKEQFLFQGKNHSADGQVGMKIYDHFITRFWPYYKIQFFVPIVIYGALIVAIFNLYKKNYSTFLFAIILTHLVWLLILGPYPRYNSILFFISIIYLLETYQAFFKQNIGLRWQIALVLIAAVSSIDVLARQSIAIIQRPIRNPYPVIQWIHQNLTNEKALIAGHDIAYYAVGQKKKIDYLLYNEHPYKYDFSNYSTFYIVSDHEISEQPMDLISTLIQESKLENKLGLTINTPTYRHLYLYKTSNAKMYYVVLRWIDRQNNELEKVNVTK